MIPAALIETPAPLVAPDLRLEMDDIEALDLGQVARQLQDPTMGPGWAAELCAAVEVDYRRFLALKRVYPHLEIVPDREVDLFWHQHLLDTQRYAADCRRIFRTFLRHDPYFDLQGEEELARLSSVYRDTEMLYVRHFAGKAHRAGERGSR